MERDGEDTEHEGARLGQGRGRSHHKEGHDDEYPEHLTTRGRGMTESRERARGPRPRSSTIERGWDGAKAARERVMNHRRRRVRARGSP